MIPSKVVLKDVMGSLSHITQNILIYECPMTYAEPHDHDSLEMAYVLEGEAEHICDGTESKITAGNFFFIDHGSIHTYKATTPTFSLLNCLFHPEFVDVSLSHCASFMSIMENFKFHMSTKFFNLNFSSQLFFDEDEKIKSILLNMLDEYNNKAPGYLQILRSKLTEVLIFSIREVYTSQTELASCDGDLSYVLDYIYKNYMNEISFKDICCHMGYSEPHLSMKFKRRFGITYTQYLQKFRIERSMRLLTSTNLSIYEVAEQVGYKDLKAYYASFRKYSDTTPAKFRKNSLTR